MEAFSVMNSEVGVLLQKSQVLTRRIPTLCGLTMSCSLLRGIGIFSPDSSSEGQLSTQQYFWKQKQLRISPKAHPASIHRPGKHLPRSIPASIHRPASIFQGPSQPLSTAQASAESCPRELYFPGFTADDHSLHQENIY